MRVLENVVGGYILTAVSHKADLVVCDVTGLHDMDEFVHSQFLLAGLTLIYLDKWKRYKSSVLPEAFAVCENYSPPPEGCNPKDLEMVVGSHSGVDDLSR
ncbi:hypothetical protein V6N13_027617 [Hibiscus sabdariffa]|uniref:Uncharacterized protein n=1 Tax=Hibiscus sabdariffa TaxID=183260 RepID=A0ABR2CFG0_9ROSI